MQSPFNVSSVVSVQYTKPWPYSNIISCCHQSVHAFTFRYNSTLLGHSIFPPKVLLHEMYITDSTKKLILSREAHIDLGIIPALVVEVPAHADHSMLSSDNCASFSRGCDPLEL